MEQWEGGERNKAPPVYVLSTHSHTCNTFLHFSRAPDTAATRSKMMYASTKDFFKVSTRIFFQGEHKSQKGSLDGVGAEIQATELTKPSPCPDPTPPFRSQLGFPGRRGSGDTGDRGVRAGRERGQGASAPSAHQEIGKKKEGKGWHGR